MAQKTGNNKYNPAVYFSKSRAMEYFPFRAPLRLPLPNIANSLPVTLLKYLTPPKR